MRIANSLGEEITASHAKDKSEKLKELCKSFKAIQLDTECHETEDETQAEAFQQECESERETFEKKYFEAIGKAQEVIDEDIKYENEGLVEVLKSLHNQEQDNTRRHEVVHRQNKPKLPEVKLAEFNGEYSQWLFFKNSFETTIHQENELSNMQKHQYLVEVLSGEARRVIEGFTITNANYENAWKLLKDTYDNQMAIIQTHMDELLDMTKLDDDLPQGRVQECVRPFIHTGVDYAGPFQIRESRRRGTSPKDMWRCSHILLQRLFIWRWYRN